MKWTSAQRETVRAGLGAAHEKDNQQAPWQDEQPASA
jgi:hypothetical protein